MGADGGGGLDDEGGRGGLGGDLVADGGSEGKVVGIDDGETFKTTQGPHPCVKVGQGFGTGAFGGDRVLMAILQIAAARVAGIDRLVYHAVDGAGVAPVERARAFLSASSVARLVTVKDLLDQVQSAGFVWGVSDGN